MKEREYTYLGYKIEQWIFGNKRYFYPSFSGNVEFTSIRAICKWLKTVKWIDGNMPTFTNLLSFTKLS